MRSEQLFVFIFVKDTIAIVKFFGIHNARIVEFKFCLHIQFPLIQNIEKV